MSPCPVPACTQVLWAAIACLALGYLLWMPWALRYRPAPGFLKWVVIVLTLAGCVLGAGVSTFACPVCGGQ